jgi:hypothetical protein
MPDRNGSFWGTQHWTRRLLAMGREVKLMSGGNSEWAQSRGHCGITRLDWRNRALGRTAAGATRSGQGTVGPMYSDNAPGGLSVAQRYNLVFAPDQGRMWLYQRGYRSVVLLLSDIDYRHDAEHLVRAEWDEPGSKVKLASVIYYPYGQTELQGELTKALAAQTRFHLERGLVCSR